MRSSPDSTPVCSPDSLGRSRGSLDSFGPIPIGLGAAVDLFCAAKAAEGASLRTVEWYQMILIRAVRRFGEARPLDAVPAAELRAWLLELRASLAAESIVGSTSRVQQTAARVAWHRRAPALPRHRVYVIPSSTADRPPQGSGSIEVNVREPSCSDQR
jgi:hypothetical protein